MYYSIDRWGCIHVGNTPLEALKKVQEAENGNFDEGNLFNLEKEIEVKQKSKEENLK